jgi:hypothetical protein
VSEVIRKVYVVYLSHETPWQVVCIADQIPSGIEGKVHVRPTEIFYTDAEEVMNQGKLGPTEERYIPRRFVFGIDDHHGVIATIFDLE